MNNQSIKNSDVSVETLENIVKIGPEPNKSLPDYIRAAVPGTVQSSSEIMSDWKDSFKHFITESFLTNDVCVYAVENDKPILYFGKSEDKLSSLVPVNEESYTRFVGAKCPTWIPCARDEISTVIESAKVGSIARIDMSDLRIRGNSNEVYHSLCVDTANYTSLNQVERNLAERIIGIKGDFEKRMKEFSDTKIPYVEIRLINPSYLKKVIPEHEARAYSFSVGYNSNANFLFAGSIPCESIIRGVRR